MKAEEQTKEEPKIKQDKKYPTPKIAYIQTWLIAMQYQ